MNELNRCLIDDEITLEEALGNLLRERGLKLASAESCTGGNIARLITSCTDCMAAAPDRYRLIYVRPSKED